MKPAMQDDIPVLYDVLQLGNKAAAEAGLDQTDTPAYAPETRHISDTTGADASENSPEAIEFAAKMLAAKMVGMTAPPTFMSPQQREEFELEVRLSVMNELQAEMGLSLQMHLEQMMEESIQEAIAQTIEQITAQLESEMHSRLRNSLQPGLQACLYAAIDQAIMKNADRLRDAPSS